MSRGFGALAGARSIAVVGASERNTIARIALANLRERGFPDRIVGIHPKGRPVDGVACVPSYEHAGDVDLALLAVGAPRLPDALRAAATAGVRTAVIPGAGANEGGATVWEELERVARETGIVVLGPNCMGFASIDRGVVPYVGSIDPDLQPGGVGLVSQSGSVLELFTALPWRVGLSHVISVGNELGVDLTEALGFLVDDPDTRAVGLFIEGIRRPEEFRSALRRAAEEDVTVVALKVGASRLGREGAASHTGALAGDARVFSAVLRDASALEVGDLEEMLAALELLGKSVARPTDRIIYVGDSGGEANLFADLAAEASVDLPPLAPATAEALTERFPSLDPAANPLDLWAIGDPEETYREGMALVAEREPHLVVLGLDKFLARAEPERAFVRASVEGIDTPGAVALMAFAGSDNGDLEILRTCWEKRVPVLRGARPALAAMAGLAHTRRWREEDAEPVAVEPTAAALQAGPGPDGWTEAEAMALVSAAGIPVPRFEVASTPREAAAAAVVVGFPAVAKALDPGLTHKTEAGGVRLGLSSADEVAAAAEDLLRLGPRALVAEQRSGRLELIVAAFRDEQFGPCALLGLGGVWTEALHEAAVVAGPGSPSAVRRALESQSWGRLLLEGARGRRFPVERITDAVLRLLAVLEARPDLHTVELNPLLLEDDGVVALDALVVPA